MKIRAGFVTNSSSSSFLVAVKGDFDKAKVLKGLGVPEDSLLFPFAVEMADVILSAKPFSPEEFLVHLSYEAFSTVEEAVENGFMKDEVALIKDGYTVYTGDVSTSEFGDCYAEAILANQVFDYETPDFILRAP